MESARLPRFKRSPEIPPLRLTSRDVEILKCLQRHRFLRSDHIVALSDGSRQQVLRRLQRLFHHGYLERPRCQIDYYQSGSRRIAYGLGNKGAAWLKRELSLRFHQMDWKQKNHVGKLFLEHALLVSDIMVAVELACRNRKDIRLLSADDLQIANMREPFQWKVDIGQRQKCGVIPDRVFGLEANGKQCWYCLEADRDTMPITRGNLDRTSFQRKLLAYEATWSQNLHRTRFGWQRFRVLTVTTNKPRVQGIIEACQGLAHGHGLFLFLDVAALAKHGDILTIPWRTSRPEKTATLT
jgi:DNA-binding Lrp family transcriptional regulator